MIAKKGLIQTAKSLLNLCFSRLSFAVEMAPPRVERFSKYHVTASYNER